MTNSILRTVIGVLGLSLVTFATTTAMALVVPKNNPNNASGAKQFDWQIEWGSIHMNSFADKLSDPGSSATPDGSVPCIPDPAKGGFCKDMQNNGIVPGTLA